MSLTVGCLAGYASSRYRGSLGFWLLPVALAFHATAHSTPLPLLFAMLEAMGIRNTTIAPLDGCTGWQAFRRVIAPVMWPGIDTVGLDSFLLADPVGR